MTPRSAVAPSISSIKFADPREAFPPEDEDAPVWAGEKNEAAAREEEEELPDFDELEQLDRFE